MNKIKIRTSFNIELDFEPASLVKRFLAWLLDLLVQVAYLIIAFRLLNGYVKSLGSSSGNHDISYNITAIQILISLPVLLYHLISEVVLNGQSIGKKLTGIKVISESGTRPSFYQFLLRWVLRPFDVTSLGLGILVLLFSAGENGAFIILFYVVIIIVAAVVMLKQSKRLGDLAAGTLVIVSRIRSNLNDTVFFDLEDSYQPRYANVLQLSDRDMNIIKTILDTSVKQHNVQLAERTSAKIRSALQITEYQQPIEFLETVLKDYNYLSDIS